VGGFTGDEGGHQVEQLGDVCGYWYAAGGLLVMCVMWEIQERRARKQVDAQVDTVRPRLAGERRPLLAGMR